MKWTELDRFTQGYIDCALWSTLDGSTTSGGYPLDEDFTWEDIDTETLALMVEDCRSFQDDNRQDLDYCELSFERKGHAFWLNRNRHGAGFWDEGCAPVYSRLSNASKVWGEFNLYVGDDDMIHGG